MTTGHPASPKASHDSIAAEAELQIRAAADSSRSRESWPTEKVINIIRSATEKAYWRGVDRAMIDNKDWEESYWKCNADLEASQGQLSRAAQEGEKCPKCGKSSFTCNHCGCKFGHTEGITLISGPTSFSGGAGGSANRHWIK